MMAPVLIPALNQVKSVVERLGSKGSGADIRLWKLCGVM